MLDYKVIAKRKYVHNQNNKLLLVKEYSIIEKEDKRYLILKLFNNTNQTLTRFDFTVVQKSLEGDYIATNVYKKNSVECSAKTSFVPEVSLEISKDCEDVIVELKNAVFETFLYDNGKKYTISAIGGRKIETNDNVISKRFVSKLPFIAVIVFLLIAALILTGTYFGVEHYRNGKDVFNINDFTFSYSTDKKDDDSPIYIKKYNGRDANIMIPEKIKEHKIEYIGEEAFKDNEFVENVNFESDIIIQKAAFQNCNKLKTVDFNKVRFISDEAFKSSSIEDFTTTKTMHIGASAFIDCKNLQNVNIDNKEETVEIFDKAFCLCRGLKNLVLQNDYKMGNEVFKGCHRLENIDVNEYDYLAKETNSLNNIFSFDGQDTTLSSTLQNVRIGHMNQIPECFVEDFGELKSLKINVINELSIPNFAFKGCKKLIDLSLPLGIKEVGLSAFEDCAMKVFNASNVESIDAKAFKNCVNLEELNITNKVTMLKEGTFSGCEKLTKINIPKKVVALPNDIFSNCKSLTEIKISPESNITSIGNNAFKGCSSLSNFEIPKTVTILGNSIFESCKNLAALIMPDNFDEIPAGMFKDCEKLIGIQEILNKHISIINESAFAGCKQLETLTIPENILVINKNVFSNCENLTTVNFVSNKCEEIKEGAFSGCKSLNSIDLPSILTRIGANAFSGCAFSDIYFKAPIDIGDSAYSGCENLRSFIIENDESKVGKEALKGCNNLETLYLPFIQNQTVCQNQTIHSLFETSNRNEVPTSLKKITIASQENFTSYCFANCSGVEQIELPKAVSFYDHAFSDCTNLTSFDFVETIRNIGTECFKNCKNLTEINIPMVGVNLESYVFKGCDGITSLIVPEIRSILLLFDANKVPETLKNITINTSYVTNILFDNCENVKQINLPYATTIEMYAFDNCFDLETVNFNEGLQTIENQAFNNCTSLQNIVIPSTVNNIGYGVFNGCNNLYEIVNKSTISTGANDYIISEVYDESDRLKIVEKDNYKFAIKDGKYYLVSYKSSPDEQITLPIFESTYTIKRSLFRSHQLNQEIIIPNCVDEIEQYAFENCMLQNVVFEINSKLKTIKNSAFANNNIEKLVFDDGLETIGENAFMYCYKLKSVTVPRTLTNIGYDAFYGCENLYEVYNNSNLNIEPGSYDNGNIAYEAIEINSPANFITIKGCTFVCTNNESKLLSFDQGAEGSCLQNRILTLPKFVTYNGKEYQTYSIRRNVFSYNSSIDEIIIPSMVKRIDAFAFSNLYNLKKVTFDDNSKLQYLDQYSFYNNEKLLEILLPDSLIEIGSQAFYNNSHLRRVRIPQKVERIGDNAFTNCYDLKEVLNLSNLPITKGSNEYGMVGLNAMFVNRTDDPYITYYDDDTYSVWAIKGKCEIRNINLTQGYREELHLPESFVLEGKTYDKYTIKDGLFNLPRLSINKLFIPKALQSFNKNTFKYEENGTLRANFGEIIFSDDSLINIIEDESFSNMNNLRNIKLPLNIREIGRRAFYNCTSLNTHIELDKLYKLHEEAFANCNSLQSFALPKTLKVIENNVFDNCSQLVYVENKSDFKLEKDSDVCGKVAKYAVYISGSYDKDPVIKEFTVSKNANFKILGINDIAFIRRVEKIKGELLEIPSTIINGDNQYSTIQLPAYSLHECNTSLEMYIPKNVTAIDQNALPTNTKISKIYYQGTKEEWEKVNIEDKLIQKIVPQYNSVIKDGSIVEENKEEENKDKEPNEKDNSVLENSKGANKFFETSSYITNRQCYDKFSFVR